MSDDVINIDSSDEESKPVNKKPKINSVKPPEVKGLAPRKNVLIPVVKQSTQQRNSVIKNSAFSNIKISNPNPFSKMAQIPINLPGGRPMQINSPFNSKPFSQKIMQNPHPKLQINQKNENKIVNYPIKQISKSEVWGVPKNSTLPVVVRTSSLAKNTLKSSEKVISTLPAGITIKRTSGQPVPKQRAPSPADVIMKKKIKNVQPHTIATVDLDDDDDDDYNRSHQVGSELPVEFDFEPGNNVDKNDDTKENEITIEIPPKDPASNKKEKPRNSSDTADVSIIKDSDPLYDKSSEDHKIIPISFYTPKKNKSDNIINKQQTVVTSCIEILDSPVKPQEIDDKKENSEDVVKKISQESLSKPEVKHTSPDKESPMDPVVSESSNPTAAQEVKVKIIMKPEDVLQVEEFIKNSPKKKDKVVTPPKQEDRKISETYQRFIDMCFELDKSDDMKKIIEKKVTAYYMSVHPSFTDSRSFCKYVDEKIRDIRKNPDSLFVYIKDVVDELKVRRVKNKKSSSDKHKSEKSKMEKNKASGDEEGEEEASQSEEEVEDEEDSVVTRRIHKLERAMRKLNKAIHKLEEREIDYEDAENSAYILADRYKSRLVRIYQKLCSLTGEREARESGVRGLSRLTLCGGRLPRLAGAVRAAAAAHTYWFPDFVDVRSCVEVCARDQGLQLRPDELHSEARLAFVEIGTLLQQRRREQEYEDLGWRLGTEPDPADDDPELAAALQRNREVSKHKEMEVLNLFAEKQVNMKLEAEPVLDAEADKSEGSEDEEDDEEEETEENQAGDVKPEESSTSKADADKTNNVAEISEKGEITTEENKENARTSDDPSRSLTEICEYLKLEKTDAKKTKKRQLEESNEDSNQSNSSSFSLIELSSSDSQDSYKSESKRKCIRNFTNLKTIRPSSAMSGINLIEDESSQSLSKTNNIESRSSEDVVLEVEDSNDVSEINKTSSAPSPSLAEDDNAMDEMAVQITNVVSGKDFSSYTASKDSVDIIADEAEETPRIVDEIKKISNENSEEQFDTPADKTAAQITNVVSGKDFSSNTASKDSVEIIADDAEETPQIVDEIEKISNENSEEQFGTPPDGNELLQEIRSEDAVVDHEKPSSQVIDNCVQSDDDISNIDNNDREIANERCEENNTEAIEEVKDNCDKNKPSTDNFNKKDVESEEPLEVNGNLDEDEPEMNLYYDDEIDIVEHDISGRLDNEISEVL